MRGKYLIKRIKKKLFGMEKYLRQEGVNIGNNCHIYSDISTTESFLITLGDNVTISNDVQFITHDASISKALPDKTDIFGRIVVGDNVFIGARSTILPNVSIASNSIIGSGSLVTKSIVEEGKIWGGVPAKEIGTLESFGNRYKDIAINIDGMSAEEKKTNILASLKKLGGV